MRSNEIEIEMVWINESMPRRFEAGNYSILMEICWSYINYTTFWNWKINRKWLVHRMKKHRYETK